MSVFEQRGGEEQRDREQKQDKSEYVWEKVLDRVIKMKN